MKSIKTTLAGIAAILTALGFALSQYTTGGFAAVDFATLITGVTAGIGLIAAKDFNVSGK
jgi:hypothetical protein